MVMIFVALIAPGVAQEPAKQRPVRMCMGGVIRAGFVREAKKLWAT
jgi:hypothetical protein